MVEMELGKRQVDVVGLRERDGIFCLFDVHAK